MYYNVPARSCSSVNPYYNPPKPKKPKLVRRSTFPVPVPLEFKVELSFPQKHYFAGESVSFNVKVSNPEGFNIERVAVALVQNTTYVSADSVRRHESPVKLGSVTMGGEGDPRYSCGNVGLGNDVDWGGSLRIPETISPESTPAVNNAGTDAPSTLDVGYVLQVMVYKYNIGEGRIHKVTEVYPIRIGQSRDSTSALSESQNQIFHSFRTFVPHELQRRMSANVAHFRWKSDQSAPPRYSSLSLNKDFGHGSTTSLETLPPNYDDITPDLTEEIAMPTTPPGDN